MSCRRPCIQATESLPPGAEMEWSIWKSLNRLRTQVGRCNRTLGNGDITLPRTSAYVVNNRRCNTSYSLHKSELICDRKRPGRSKRHRYAMCHILERHYLRRDRHEEEEVFYSIIPLQPYFSRYTQLANF